MKYTDAKGWTGGDSRTLYAITDNTTGLVLVRPGHGLAGIGPEVVITVATKEQAEEHWQNPLHSGWKVAPSTAKETQ